MAAESMVRTLDAQARAIWPQESALFSRYGSPGVVLDVGCGTGEITARLAAAYPNAAITGVELDGAHVRRARARCAGYGSRVQIHQGDAYALPLDDAAVDLVVCRHLLQAIPEPEAVVAQCARVLRPEGWCHLLVEDYTMIHIDGPPRLDRFWLDGPVQLGIKTGCDMRIGRRGVDLLAGFDRRRLDFITVDTERVARQDFVNIWSAWRDGYSDVLAPVLDLPVAEVRAIWDDMIHAIRHRYALWQVPVVSGQRPGRGDGQDADIPRQRKDR